MTSRNVLVVGATGGTGQHVVAQALQQGHHVTVLVRDPRRLTVASDRLRVLTGSVTDDEQGLAAAVRGQDVVISALGLGKSLKSNGLIARSVPAIVKAMAGEGVRRLIFTSAFGVGVTQRDVPLVPRILIRVFLRDIYADKQASETVLMRSALDWTLVYPSMLTDGPRMGHYRVGERLALSAVPKISRADVADCLLAQIEDLTNVRRGVLVSY